MQSFEIITDNEKVILKTKNHEILFNVFDSTFFHNKKLCEYLPYSIHEQSTYFTFIMIDEYKILFKISDNENQKYIELDLDGYGKILYQTEYTVK